MTDISVTSAASQVEDRSWLLSPHGTDPGTNPSVTLDFSLFTAGTHYPNGYIPSGTAVARVTATNLFGPADAAANDGRQLTTDGNLGLTFGSVPVKAGRTKAGTSIVVHGFVRKGRLPFQSGTGSVTAAIQTALRLIYFTA